MALKKIKVKGKWATKVERGLELKERIKDDEDELNVIKAELKKKYGSNVSLISGVTAICEIVQTNIYADPSPIDVFTEMENMGKADEFYKVCKVLVGKLKDYFSDEAIKDMKKIVGNGTRISFK